MRISLQLRRRIFRRIDGNRQEVNPFLELGRDTALQPDMIRREDGTGPRAGGEYEIEQDNPSPQRFKIWPQQSPISFPITSLRHLFLPPRICHVRPGLCRKYLT